MTFAPQPAWAADGYCLRPALRGRRPSMLFLYTT